MTNTSSPDLTHFPPQNQPHPHGPPPQGHRRQPRRRRGMGFFGWIGFLLLALIAVAIGAISVFVLSPPTDFIRDQMITQVKQKTGRDLTISGPVGITIFPALGLSLSDVALSSPSDMEAPPLVKMSKLNVEVKLAPLLSKAIEVDTLVLTDPVFNLRVDKQGQRNWDFAFNNQNHNARYIRLADASGLSNATIRLAQAATDAPRNTTSNSSDLQLKDISLGDVRIINGTLKYADATSGSRQRLEKINVKLGLEKINRPLTANGDIVWKDEKVGFDATLNTPQDIMAQRPAKIAVKFSGKPLSGNYSGTLGLKDGIVLAGDLGAQTSSARNLARWFGTNLPPSNGFGPLKLNGRLEATNATYRLSKANLNLDGAEATGSVAVQTGGVRPKIIANLKLSELNLNTYMSGSGDGNAQPANNAGKAEPQTIDDLLADPEAAPGTRVKGYTQREGWSNEPIDISALRSFDADAKLQVRRLLYKKIKVDRTNLAVKLAKGKMRTDFTDIILYDGQGRGVVTLDSNKTPTVGANFVVNNVSALPLLTDAADVKFIEGRGTLKLAVAGRGRSQLGVIETLNGNGSFNFTDGALVGFNIPQAYRSLSQGRLANLKAAATEKTDFSALTATFKIKNGVATNTDLTMLSPLLRVRGSGRIMLPPRQVDYTVVPKVVDELTGQGGATDVGGLEIPVHITGSFQNLKYTPKLDALVKDPNKAVETIRNIGKRFRGKNAGEIVNDLLGGGDENGGKKIDGKKLLEQFLQ